MKPVMASETAIDRERERVREIRDDLSGWRRWGPYLSDRSWGTVREDYSADGNAWGYLTYDKARAKAYRWGEDGIAGICDRYQLLCFAPAFWNERDPHLKERFFGVNPYEGNHGEDVKEYYFHVDNTPTHSYMCLLYKYPQARVSVSRARSRRTSAAPDRVRSTSCSTPGIFDDDRYFDIFIEYAKADPRGPRDPDHRAQPRARRRAAAHPADACGSATRGPGGRRRSPSRRSRASATGGIVPGRPTTAARRRSQHAGALPARHALATRSGPAAPAAVHRQRDQRRARLRARQHQPQAAHQGRVPPRDLRGRRDAVSPDALRHQGGAALQATWCRRAARSRCACGSPTGRRASALADVDAIIAARKAEADAFYAAARPARRDRRRAARAAPRARGAPVDQAELPLRRRALARRRQPGRSRRRHRGARSATATGAT